MGFGPGSAIVAGGASGLGEATARRLHELGARVLIADLNAERGLALAAELGERASFLATDVTDPDAVVPAVEAAAAGEGGLRISVCCAGIGWAERVAGKRGPHAFEAFERVIRVNLIGTFNVLRLAAAAMIPTEPGEDGERGVCVNTASVAAFDGQVGQIAYSASKGGVVGMTLPAARDLAHFDPRDVGRDAHPAVGRVLLYTHAHWRVAALAKHHHIGNRDRRFLLDDTAGTGRAARLGVALDDIQPLDNHAAGRRDHFEHLAGLAALAPGDHHHHVILLDRILGRAALRSRASGCRQYRPAGRQSR